MGQDFRPSDLKDVRIHSVVLGEGIKGFAYVSKRGISHIFIEVSLSPECTSETLAHEAYHLKHDNLSHGIGLDKQGCQSERRANKFAKRNRDKLFKLMSPTAI